jgi:hypothetical protein
MAKPQHNRKKNRAINNPNATGSIVQYPEYRNAATIQVGFDIDVESGVVAAGQEQHGASDSLVGLFSLHGYECLKGTGILN